jgi:hypothetical protein
MIKSQSKSLLINFLVAVVVVIATLLFLLSFPVAALLLKNLWFRDTNPGLYFIWVYRIFTLIVSLSFILFLYRQALRLLTFIAATGTIVDIRKKSTIVSLLLTLLVIPRAAAHTIYGSTISSFNFFRNILNHSLMFIMGPNESMAAKADIAEFITLFYRNALGFFNKFTDEIRQLLSSLPMTDTFLFFSIWLLTAIAADLVFGRDESISARIPDLGGKREALLTFLKSNRHRILFNGTLIFALFLSVSAMIAVPYVSQNAQSFKYDPDYLKKSIETYQISDAFLVEELKSHEQDSLAYKRSIAKWLNVSADSLEKICHRPLPGSVKQKWTRHMSDVNTLLKQAIANDQKQVKNIFGFKKEVALRQKRESQLIQDNFLLASNSLTHADEANEYFKRLVWWYSEESDNLKSVLEDEYNKLKTNSSLQNTIFSFLSNNIENQVEELKQAREIDQFYFLNTENNVKSGLASHMIVINDATFKYTPLPMPALPRAGMNWGIFGQISQWLLISRSYELAILTGMFGFGLFGASISTLIRYQDSNDHPPQVGYRIIVKGLSAAVLLFLSIMGGSAILGIETSKPNAYSLFFLCLIGSVFSDSVWEWAKSKLPGANGTTGEPKDTEEIKP